MKCGRHARHALIAVAAAICVGTASAPRAAEYVVGIIAPLSGPWAALGIPMGNGVTLALEQAEDAATFRQGVRLSLKQINEAGDAQALTETVRKFVRNEGAILLVGPVFSATAQAVAVAANQDGFPLLSPAVSPGVTLAGNWAFRTGASPYDMIKAFSTYLMKALRPATIALAYTAGNAGFESQAEAFSRSVAQEGGSIVAEIRVSAADDNGLVNAAGSIYGASPDLVFFCMDAEPAAAIAVNLRRAGLPERTRFAFAPAAAQPALIRIGGAAVENALLATDYLPELAGEQNRAFVAAYKSRFGAPADRWAGIGYSAGLIAAEAIRNAGPAPGRRTVRLALERIAEVAVPLGGSAWQQDDRRNPSYLPALFTIRSGAFVPLNAGP